jgi:hypothetical protein
MMLAWFDASETMRSLAPARVVSTPRLAWYPGGKEERGGLVKECSESAFKGCVRGSLARNQAGGARTEALGRRGLDRGRRNGGVAGEAQVVVRAEGEEGAPLGCRDVDPIGSPQGSRRAEALNGSEFVQFLA